MLVLNMAVPKPNLINVSSWECDHNHTLHCTGGFCLSSTQANHTLDVRDVAAWLLAAMSVCVRVGGVGGVWGTG